MPGITSEFSFRSIKMNARNVTGMSLYQYLWRRPELSFEFIIFTLGIKGFFYFPF